MKQRPFFLVVAIVSLLVTLASAQAGAALPALNGNIRINEVMFCPQTGQPEWVELKNAGASPVSLQGWGLTDEDGNWYRFPSALPTVPAGAFVVVVFDGAGSASDDYDFSDNVATLHSPAGVVNIFEDDADQVALYSDSLYNKIYLPLIQKSGGTSQPASGAARQPRAAAPPVVSFVAWGADPGSDAQNAITAGVWGEGMFKDVNAPGEPPTPLVTPGMSLGLVPGTQTGYADEFTLYQVGQVTRGSENPVPAVVLYTYAGDTQYSDTFALNWNWVEEATGYRFQMDNNSDLSSPEVDLILPDPAYVPQTAVVAGTYYWRVKAILATGEGPWSPIMQVLSMATLRRPAAPQDTVDRQLNIAWQLQRKDTKMLCLLGDSETGDAVWDAPPSRRRGSNQDSR